MNKLSAWWACRSRLYCRGGERYAALGISRSDRRGNHPPRAGSGIALWWNRNGLSRANGRSILRQHCNPEAEDYQRRGARSHSGRSEGALGEGQEGCRSGSRGSSGQSGRQPNETRSSEEDFGPKGGQQKARRFQTRTDESSSGDLDTCCGSSSILTSRPNDIKLALKAPSPHIVDTPRAGRLPAITCCAVHVPLIGEPRLRRVMPMRDCRVKRSISVEDLYLVTTSLSVADSPDSESDASWTSNGCVVSGERQ